MSKPKMTGRERILAAINHQEADRVPISPRIHAWTKTKYGDSELATELKYLPDMDPIYTITDGTPSYLEDTPDEYELPDVLVEQTKHREKDCLVVERTFRTPAGALSDRIKIYPGGGAYGVSPNPVKLEDLVKIRDDIEALKYIFPPVNTNYHHLRHHEGIMGDRGIVSVNIHSGLNHNAGRARSMEDLMMDYHLDRPFFDELLEIFHERSLEQSKAALEAGCKFIFGNWYFNSVSAGWSPAIFREVFLPQLREHVDLAHGYDAYFIHYDDGKLSQTMEMISAAGVDILDTCTPPPVGDFDLAEAKRKIGGRTTLKGYIDLVYVMLLGTPELVEKTVREAMVIGKPGGGFIIGSSDSFRDGTPDRNVWTYFEACKKYGVYR